MYTYYVMESLSTCVTYSITTAQLYSIESVMV